MLTEGKKKTVRSEKKVGNRRGRGGKEGRDREGRTKKRGPISSHY